MHWNLDITVYSTDKLGNRIHRRAIPFTDNDCCNTCFFSFLDSICVYLWGSAVYRHPWKANLKKENQFFVFFTVRIADISKRQTKSTFVQTRFEYFKDFSRNLGSPSWMFKTPHSSIRSKERFNWWWQKPKTCCSPEIYLILRALYFWSKFWFPCRFRAL